MGKTSFTVIPAIVLAATLSVHGQAPAGQGLGAAPPPAPAPMAIKQIKPGLFMVTGFGGNSIVRVTEQGVILVDTKNLGDGPYKDLMAQIGVLTHLPVKYVFVTHVHQDHSGNIGRFVTAGAQVITHEGLKRNLETGGVDGKGYTSPAGKPDPPSATYSRTREVTLGKGKAIGGSVLTFPKALDEALKLDWDVAIPGHGNDPMTRADVQAYQKKWDAIARKALELRKQGVSKEEIRQQIQAQVPEMAPWTMTGIVNDMRLDGFYAELSNAK